MRIPQENSDEFIRNLNDKICYAVGEDLIHKMASNFVLIEKIDDLVHKKGIVERHIFYRATIMTIIGQLLMEEKIILQKKEESNEKR